MAREMAIDAWLTPAAAAQMRASIAEAVGNEVFFVGQFRDDVLDEVVVAARGTRVAVPALAPYIDGADVLIHNHPSGHLQPSDADLAIASVVGDEGKGFFIVDNQVERVYVVAEPVADRERVALHVDTLAGVVAPDGALQRHFAGYEYRSGQQDMLRAVCDAFNDEAIVVAEAGTGIGKSLAYLVPAVAWAASNSERVVVSTATINLQQQLMEKDVPLVQRILGTDVPACLVKGRGNYLCQRRLRGAMTATGGAAADPRQPTEQWLFEEASEPVDGTDAESVAHDEIVAIYEWSLSSQSGSRSDAAFNPSPAAWSRVCSEADACGALRCPNRDRCFVLRARREAAAARLLIVNHHLLFSDLAARLQGGGNRGASLDASAVLPGFRRLIIDEAHAIEPSALSFLSENVTGARLQRYCSRFHARRAGRESGFLVRRSDWFEASGSNIGELMRQVASLRDLARRLDVLGAGLLGDEAAMTLPDGSDEPAAASRLLLAELERQLLDLATAGAAAVEQLSNEQQESDDAMELRVEVRRLRATATLAARLRGPAAGAAGAGESVRWVERVGRAAAARSASPRFIATPLDVAPLLKSAVFDRYPTIVMTSATLTVGGTFDFWRQRVGLGDDSNAFVEQYESPFAYASQALLGVPVDGVAPNDPRHTTWLSGYLIRLLRVSQGRALVLFTSYAMLNAVYRVVAPALAADGIEVWQQNDDDRHRLLARFSAEATSVLFATDSFWEGVDIPGASLQLVAICRLPFGVPTHPVARAQLEQIARAGGNPFAELTLPRAVMRVRQGFGRLVRRSDDRGVVALLDPRVASRDYGELFLASLPVPTCYLESGDELLQRIDAFLRNDGGA
jgi:ATP-dependent DNA helicase DinG